MALQTFHPCQFNFRTTDISRVGSVTSAGRSLSGFEDQIEGDGGGYLQAAFTDGSVRDRQDGLAWRAMTDLDGGEAVIVLLCAERHFQPVLDRVGGLPNTPIADDAPDKGAGYAASAAAALRATSITINGTSERPLEAGALFSIQHPNWGWRAYRIRTVVDNGGNGFTLTFRTPLREAVIVGTPIEFDIPRCQMVVLQKTSNPTNIGLFTSCAITFVEHMAPPVSA